MANVTKKTTAATNKGAEQHVRHADPLSVAALFMHRTFR